MTASLILKGKLGQYPSMLHSPVTGQNCVVITGGPSSGKTTILKKLQANGFNVLPEAARAIILEGIHHPKKNRQKFQEVVTVRQLEVEASRNKSALYFCDRGLLDSWAYLAVDNILTDKKPDFNLSHYMLCLVLEPLNSFEYDGVRPKTENLAFSRRLTPVLEETYRQYGIPVTRVPDLGIEERFAFILQATNQALENK
jgi:predicted ATPase